MIKTEFALTELANKQPLLRVEGLVKAFREKGVLADLDFTITSREIVAIVGRSGCGKSTFLRLIAGLETPSSGRILVDGKVLRGINPAARLMFQDAALLPWRTVEENVRLAAPQRDRRIAADALREVGLANRSQEWPGVLSGGQKQRVALARALTSRSSLLLLDEPLGALDALTRLEMQRLIERLWQHQQFAALMITHDVEEAVALADRVIVMDAGRFIHESAIDLPRLRDRSSRSFLALKDDILNRVHGGDPA